MRNCLFYIILSPILLFNIQIEAQSLKKIIRSADEAFESGNYYGAAISYKSILKENKVPKIAYKYAEACRLNHNYPEAKKWYQFVLFNAKEKYPLSRYWLGVVNKSSGNYQKAQYHFNRFIKWLEKDAIKVDEYYVIKAKHEIIACEKAFYYKLEPNGILINHLDTMINSLYSDFGITDINDSIILFGSYKPTGHPDSSDFIAQLYETNNNEDQYNKYKLFDTIINQTKKHITNPAYSQQQQCLYFCISPLKQSRLESNIYKSYYKNGKWQKPEKLPEKINQPGTVSIHPSIAEIGDKEYLLFVSNRKDGIGHLDIWFTEILNNNKFGEVLNIGSNLNKLDQSERHYLKQVSTINSMDDEITPFFNKYDSTLYFSSQWHYSMGGFDIFKVKGDFKNWGEIENLGYPLNTSDNEIYYYINSKGGNAYLASNRSGSMTYNNDRCCNDIYSHVIPKYIDEKEIEENKIKTLENDIRLLVPLTLYFHNDEPNPATRDTTTEFTYEETYSSYINMIEEYKTIYASGAKKNKREEAANTIENFFNDEVIKGYNKLNEFILLAQQLLQKGENIEITIKGFASPLHASDYNVNLSRRRINSLVNLFYKYENGFFLQYINGNSEKGNTLTFKEEAYGEDTASLNISDDLSDKRNSVYSPTAAYERKIKVIAISLNR